MLLGASLGEPKQSAAYGKGRAARGRSTAIAVEANVVEQLGAEALLKLRKSPTIAIDKCPVAESRFETPHPQQTSAFRPNRQLPLSAQTSHPLTV